MNIYLSTTCAMVCALLMACTVHILQKGRVLPVWLFPQAAYSYGMLNSPEVKEQTRISLPHTLTAGLNSISMDFLQ